MLIPVEVGVAPLASVPLIVESEATIVPVASSVLRIPASPLPVICELLISTEPLLAVTIPEFVELVMFDDVSSSRGSFVPTSRMPSAPDPEIVIESASIMPALVSMAEPETSVMLTPVRLVSPVPLFNRPKPD